MARSMSSASRRTTRTSTGKASNFSREQFDQVTSIDKAAWLAELGLHEQLFQQLAQGLPAALPATKAKIEERLNAA